MRLPWSWPHAPLAQGMRVHEAEVRHKVKVTQKRRGGGWAKEEVAKPA